MSVIFPSPMVNESALNDYKRGQIRYPFSKLAIGKHHLSIKVWDVYNNSTTAYTEFIVADGEAMALDHVINECQNIRA